MTMVSHSHSRTSPRSLMMFALACLAVLGVGILFAYMLKPMIAAETTGSITGTNSACLARLPTNYSPRVLEQCVDACITCNHGTAVTCTTACKLHGAN